VVVAPLEEAFRAEPEKLRICYILHIQICIVILEDPEQMQLQLQVRNHKLSEADEKKKAFKRKPKQGTRWVQVSKSR